MKRTNPLAVILGLIALTLVPSQSFGQAAPDQSAPGVSDNGEEALKLTPFQVTASTNTGYGAQTLSSSSRLNLKYIDVPQTVSVVTAEFLKDAYLFDNHDFVKYVNNINPRSNGHDETFYIRGLQVLNSYVDGFLASGPLNRDAALYDRIEYVQGPASAALGRGDAGGLINYISKAPVMADRTSFLATVGNHKFYRADIDYNGIISQDKKMALRVPVYISATNGTRDPDFTQTTKKYGFGPSFLWNVSPDTQVLVNASVTHTESPGNVGEMWFSKPDLYNWLVVLGAVTTSAYQPLNGVGHFVPDKNLYGFPGRGRITDVYQGMVKVTHKFSDSISIREGVRWDKYAEDYRRFLLSPGMTVDPKNPADFLVFMTYSRNLAAGEGLRNIGDVLIEKKVLGVSNQIVMGYEASRITQSSGSKSLANVTQDLYNPSYTLPAGFDPLLPAVNTLSSTNNAFGYYAGYTGSLFDNKLVLNASWRDDKFRVSSRNLLTNVTTPSVTNSSVPRFSLSYKPVPSMTLYFVKSEQEDPPITTSAYSGFRVDSGATLPPASDPRYAQTVTGQVRANMNEIGWKAAMLENRLTLSVAVFQGERTGFIFAGSGFEPGANGIGQVTYSTAFVSPLPERVNGVSFEVFGEPTKHLTFTAGFSSEDGSAPVASGTLYPTPSLMDTVSGYGRYDFRDQRGDGFALTLGGKYWFGGWNLWPGVNARFKANQYNVDVGGSYYWNRGKYFATLKVNNLTDQTVILTPTSQWDYRRIYFSVGGKF